MSSTVMILSWISVFDTSKAIIRSSQRSTLFSITVNLLSCSSKSDSAVVSLVDTSKLNTQYAPLKFSHSKILIKQFSVMSSELCPEQRFVELSQFARLQFIVCATLHLL